MFNLGFVLYGTTVLIPQFLQLLLGYPAVVAGEALAGGGFIMMVMMPITGTLVSRVDPRKLMSFGFAATAVALYYMATHLTLDVDFRTVAMLRVYQTMGLAFIFIPSNVLAYVNIPAREQQPGIEHDQFRAEYRRKRGHRAGGHFHHAHHTVAPILFVFEPAHHESSFPADGCGH